MLKNFLAEETCLERLSGLGDKLETITKAPVNRDAIRERIDGLLPDRTKGGRGGRPPVDKLPLFKMTLLKRWYALSNEGVEYQVTDRLSFRRFLGMSLSDRVPDSNTVRMFEEALADTEADPGIFHMFVAETERIGIVTNKGAIIDATFAEAPRQRNTREENRRIKENGTAPEGWSKKKAAHKDADARRAKKNNETHYGCKDHIRIDRAGKIITDFEVTDASVHDIRRMAEPVGPDTREAWLDSAYVSEELEAEIREMYPGIILHIIEKAGRGKPLTEEQKERNRMKSKVRARVEHVNGRMKTNGGLFVRTVGRFRAETVICLTNLACNISRFAFLAKNMA